MTFGTERRIGYRAPNHRHLPAYGLPTTFIRGAAAALLAAVGAWAIVGGHQGAQQSDVFASNGDLVAVRGIKPHVLGPGVFRLQPRLHRRSRPEHQPPLAEPEHDDDSHVGGREQRRPDELVDGIVPADVFAKRHQLSLDVEEARGVKAARCVEGGLRTTLINAVETATRRARELGRGGK